MKFKIIFLIGPPLSGKDTQGKLLVKKIKGSFMVTSSVLKEFFQKTKKRYLKIEKKIYDLYQEKEKIAKGELVSPDLVAAIVIEKLKEFLKKRKSLVISGSPRTLREAKKVLRFLENNLEAQSFIFLFLDVSVKEILKRASQRKREDDQLEILQKRIALYKKITLPAIIYLKKKKVLIRINGQDGVKKICQKILEKLKSKNL